MDDWQCLPDNRRDFGLNFVQFVRVLSRRELATEKALITKRFVLENLHPLSAASFELALLIEAPILPDFVFVHRKWHRNPKFDRSHFFLSRWQVASIPTVLLGRWLKAQSRR